MVPAGLGIPYPENRSEAFCLFTPRLLSCLSKCPESEARDYFAHELSEIVPKYCNEGMGPEVFEAYARRADELEADVEKANNKLTCAQINPSTFNAEKFCNVVVDCALGRVMEDELVTRKYDTQLIHEFQVQAALDLFMEYIDFLKDEPLPAKCNQLFRPTLSKLKDASLR